MHKLSALYLRSALLAERQRLALREILRLFHQISISVVLLKGAALRVLVYKNPALRPMCDVDLLVRRSELKCAAQTLVAHGYSPRVPIAKQEFYEREHHHLAPLVSIDGLVVVELHSDLIPPAQRGRLLVTVDDIWQRAEAAPAVSLPAFVPCPAHLLLHLCLHSLRSHCIQPPLACLSDLSQSVSALDVDWQELVETACRWNAERYAYLGLMLAESFAPGGTPALVLSRLKASAGFRGAEHAAVLGAARYAVLRPVAHRRIPLWLQVELWSILMEPLGVVPKFLAAAKSIYNGLVRSSRAKFANFPEALMPYYALGVHPFFLLCRAVGAATKKRDASAKL